MGGNSKCRRFENRPLYKAPPAPASPAATGYVEFYTGWASTENSTNEFVPGIGSFPNTDKLDGWPIGGAGRANYWFMPNASVQIDAQAEGTSYRWMQATLYLQGGYDRTVSVDSFTDNIHAAFVRGTGRYFFDQNVMIEATGQYAKGARDFTDMSLLPAFGLPSQPFQTLLWQAKLEWKPATLPFSFFVKYQGSETRYDTLNDGGFRTLDQKTTDQRFLVGARLYAGQGITLKGNDRAGTTLDIIDPLGTHGDRAPW